MMSLKLVGIFYRSSVSQLFFDGKSCPSPLSSRIAEDVSNRHSPSNPLSSTAIAKLWKQETLHSSLPLAAKYIRELDTNRREKVAAVFNRNKNIQEKKIQEASPQHNTQNRAEQKSFVSEEAAFSQKSEASTLLAASLSSSLVGHIPLNHTSKEKHTGEGREEEKHQDNEGLERGRRNNGDATDTDLDNSKWFTWETETEQEKGHTREKKSKTRTTNRDTNLAQCLKLHRAKPLSDKERVSESDEVNDVENVENVVREVLSKFDTMFDSTKLSRSTAE